MHETSEAPVTLSDMTESSTGEVFPIHTSATRSHLPAAHSERKSQPMKYNASTLGRRAAAAAGVLTLAVLGLAPMAQAENANYGNINEDATGSLNIHKHLNGDGKPIGNADGTEVPNANKGAPVKGVVFTAYPITDINLKKSEDWTKLGALTAPGAIPDSACANPAAPALAGHTLGSGMPSSETDDQGLAKISDMSVKAYLVCETKAPGNIVQKAKPFVVTIPHPNTAKDQAGNWIYDVHVYPKNEKTEVTKTIEDQKANGYAVGSKVRFPVSSTLPKLDDGAHYKYFQLKDTLDANLTGVTAKDVTLDGAPMEASDYEVKTTGQTVTVTFTKAGLAKLKAAAGKKVQAIFEGTVASIGNGNIKNTAQLISDTIYASTPPEPTEPPTDPDNPPTSDEVTTTWGDLTIKKVDSHDKGASKAGLKGAEFQLFKAQKAYDDTCTKEKEGAPIAVDGKTTLTTDENGVVNIKGLFVSDSVAGADRDNKVGATSRCYVLVETKAPTGFVLPSGDDAVTAVKIQAGAVTTDNVTVENTKQAVPGLPLTGANGMLILTASGASLLMIAVGSVLVARYRERKQNANLAA